MSGVFVMAPVLVAAPVVMTAATAVAATMGFTLAVQAVMTEETADEYNKAELDIDSKGLTQLVNEQGSLVLTRGDATIRFFAGKGRCQMHVIGKASEAELEALGQEVIDKMTQQYAYHRVMTDLKSRGFAAVEETQDEDGTIRLRLRRWD